MVAKQLPNAPPGMHPLNDGVQAEQTPVASLSLPELATFLTDLDHVAFRWDAASDEMVWSDNAPAIFAGIAVADLATGHRFSQLIEIGRNSRAEALATGGPDPDSRYEIEYALRTGPNPTWVEETGRRTIAPDGRLIGARGIIRMINDRFARDEKLRGLAKRDPLTGEIGRVQLVALLGEAITSAQQTNTPCAFLLLGIDQLSRINDSYGFDVADEVICETARRLRYNLRADDILGRFSNTKFGIVLKNCSSEDIAIAAERFISVIRNEVVHTKSGPVAVTASVGGVSTLRHGRTVNDTISRALEALDVAQQRRIGSFNIWTPSARRENLRRQNIRIADEIVSACNERRILIAYEPAVSAQTRRIAFHECLVRVVLPSGELLTAPDIVPVAERLGLIRLIDQRVLELVIKELIACPDIRLSLNVSPDTTTDPEWWQSIEAMLGAYPHVAERLIVEITETVAIKDLEEVRTFVSRLKKLGSRIAIDDFGAGYTSFRNLRELGVDIVKIDGTFVRNLPRSADDRAFVQTLIDLARRLEIETVAEWVQDETSADMLRSWGCDYLQGSLIGLAAAERSRQPGKLCQSRS